MDFTQPSTWYPMLAGTGTILLVLLVIWSMMRSVEKAHRRNLANSTEWTRTHKRRTAKQVAEAQRLRDEEWAQVTRLHKGRALIAVSALGLVVIDALIVAILVLDKTPFLVVAAVIVLGFAGLAWLLVRPLPAPDEVVQGVRADG